LNTFGYVSYGNGGLKTFAHYELIDTVGRGGMGVVYKARDTKLGRFVALKFLPEDRATDKRLIARFRREARAASALNHPNICTIFDIDEVDGQTFIVMELLKGVSLKDFIHGKPLPVEVAIPIAIEMAEALEASHAGGIVHRDIKPSNVFVCANNHIKVLDFGLALQTEPAEVPGQIGQTLDANELTISGTAIGTIAYMAPEQARCEEVDTRADLFSFGAVLYEMLTGKAAFASTSIALTFQGILSGNPAPPSKVNSAVGPELEAIILRLLEKKRERRYPSVVDLKNDLIRLRGEWSGTQVFKIPQPKTSTALLVALVLILSVGAAWMALRFFQSKPQSDQAVFTHFTTQPGQELFPNFSPDGKTIAYAGAAAGNWDVYIQRVGGHNSINLTADSASDDTQPAFSPNGDSIAFRSDRDGGGIFIMGATGESAHRVSNFGFNPAWSPDGNRLVVAEETVGDNPQYRYTTSSLWTIVVASGEKKKIFNGDAVQPQWSPHNERIAYWAQRGGTRGIWTVRTDGTDPVLLTTDSSLNWNPVWAGDGHAIYFSSDRAGGTDLWRIPVDESTGRSTGLPEAITKGGTAQRMHATVSSDGQKIAYVEETVAENIFQAPFDPVAAKVTGTPKPITVGARVASEPDLASDGEHVVFQSLGKKMNLYVVRLDGTGERQLTDEDFQDRVPRFSPDGTQVAFYSNRSGPYQIWGINTDGSNLHKIFDDRAGGVLRTVWSPTGNHLAARHEDGTTFLVSLTKGEPVETLPPPPNPAEIFDVWSWSPDGNWLAGHRSRVKGNFQGLVLFSLLTKTYHNLTDSGTFPVWLKDSRRLLFVDEFGNIASIDRESRKITKVLSVKPNVVSSLGQLSTDNKALVYSAEQREADIWLITRESSK
jgi:serine/threonine protein kinase/WD40 repeat protein